MSLLVFKYHRTVMVDAMKAVGMRERRTKTAGLGALEYILLAIVVIVLVAAAWLFLSGYIGSAAVNPKAAVQQFDITVASDGTAAVTLVIKNTGNVRITDASILGWGGLASSATAPSLTFSGLPTDPGKTLMATNSAPVPSGTFILGQQYNVRVQITYANGATEVLVAQATAHP